MAGSHCAPQPASSVLYSEDSDTEICEDLTKSPLHGTMSSSRLNRKRRRGFIEKRRRDRINNCLNELKRLVPTAYEKQGSQKLEKAEILQMTVDHLRILQTRGIEGLMDTSRAPSEYYQSMGFRECATEVARFMATEGLDIQDPLRVRLMNHLQTHLSYISTAVQGVNRPVGANYALSMPNSGPFTAPASSDTLGTYTQPSLPVTANVSLISTPRYDSSDPPQTVPATDFMPIEYCSYPPSCTTAGYTPNMHNGTLHTPSTPILDNSPMKAPTFHFPSPHPGTAGGQYGTTNPANIYCPMPVMPELKPFNNISWKSSGATYS